MRVSERVGCTEFPCADVSKASYIVPEVKVWPARAATSPPDYPTAPARMVSV